MDWTGAAYAGASLVCAALATLAAWYAHKAAGAVLREHVHDAHASFAPCLGYHPDHGPCIRPREHLDEMHINAQGWTWNGWELR